MHRPLHVVVPVQGPPITLEVGLRRVRLIGDLDAFTGRNIEAELLAVALERRSVVVDLSDLDVLTSGGIAVLERCHDRAVAEGHRFILAVRPATMVQRVLAYAGVKHHVLSHTDEPKPPRQRRPDRSA